MPSKPYETLVYELAEGVATITLHRPDRMNAFTSEMMSELLAVFDRVDRDDDVRAVIVTGAGRAFCAGADLGAGGAAFDRSRVGEREEAEGRVGDIFRDRGGRITLRIFESLKPVIGAVNGAAVGVGATMLLPMDIRLASESAKFGFVFARRGIAPDGAASWFLPRVVGMQAALDWCLSGRVFSAEEALQRQLVLAVCAPQDLLPRARAIAREICDNAAPVSVALTRRLLWRGLCADHPMQAHRAESRAIQVRGRQQDAQEGVTSFLEKRAPAYVNKVTQDFPDVWPEWTPPIFR